MVNVIYNHKVIAQTDDTVVVEENHYFPKEVLSEDLLEESDLTTTCPWKGEAHYYHLIIDGKKLENMVWYYPNPKEKAKMIKDRIAFYQKSGLIVREE
ncbi:MAG: DUF427 domain-containing protein [Bacteroidetes bacterium]|nr:DUF427 domain-containing protein [Bacteroidota bacterium]